MLPLNAPRWPALRYEVWYLTAIDPGQRRAIWLRWTLQARRSGAPKATLWGFAFEDGVNVARVREDWPLEAAQLSSSPFRVAIGGSELTSERATGSLRGHLGELTWDLRLGEGRCAWSHFDPRLFDRGLAQTCVASPRLDLPVSGVVLVNGARWELRDAPGQQTHIWARRPTADYLWAHCNAFDDAPGVTFEGLSAVLEKGPLRLPAAGPLLLDEPGKRRELRGLMAMFSVRSERGFGRWRFEGASGGWLLAGEVEVAPESVVAVEYEDPVSGERLTCHNSLVADMTLRLYEARGARWHPLRSWRSRATTAFEVMSRERDPRVEAQLTLEDGESREASAQ